MKKIALTALCLGLLMMLAGCATVNSENSFQSQAPAEVATSTAVPEATQAPQQPQNQPADAPAASQPAAEPTQSPASGGFNG